MKEWMNDLLNSDLLSEGVNVWATEWISESENLFLLNEWWVEQQCAGWVHEHTGWVNQRIICRVIIISHCCKIRSRITLEGGTETFYTEEWLWKRLTHRVTERLMYCLWTSELMEWSVECTTSWAVDRLCLVSGKDGISEFSRAHRLSSKAENWHSHFLSVFRKHCSSSIALI